MGKQIFSGFKEAEMLLELLESSFMSLLGKRAVAHNMNNFNHHTSIASGMQVR
jgi:hypothetical protein